MIFFLCYCGDMETHELHQIILPQNAEEVGGASIGSWVIERNLSYHPRQSISPCPCSVPWDNVKHVIKAPGTGLPVALKGWNHRQGWGASPKPQLGIALVWALCGDPTPMATLCLGTL